MLDAAPRTKARSAICASGRMVGVIVSPKAGALRNAEPLTRSHPSDWFPANCVRPAAALGKLLIWG